MSNLGVADDEIPCWIANIGGTFEIFSKCQVS